MLEFAHVPLKRLQPLENNSKRHNTAGTLQSINEHGFRDPIQVDLALLEDHNDLTVEQILKNPKIPLPIVCGHDRRNALIQRFQDHPDKPPEDCKPIKGDWLVPVLIMRSESYAMALKYSVDHNLTTASVLGEDVLNNLFDSELLLEQAELIAQDISPDASFSGAEINMTDLIASLSNDDAEEDDSDNHDPPEDNADIDEEKLAETKHKCPACGFEF
jgi:hypothetical protein